MSKQIKKNIKAPTVLDLFCGAGGMSLGFQNAGCQVLGGIDNNPHAVKTHHENFPKSNFSKNGILACDIADIDLPELLIKPGDVDILIGAPPCQVFSVVGMGKIRSLGREIKQDSRNFLYKHFVVFLDYYKPFFFVIENVNTLKNNDIFSILTRELESGLPVHGHEYPGYNIKYQILTASDYGVPQLRKRLFIVGIRKDTNLSFEFPPKNTFTPISVGEAIGDLLPLEPISMPLKPKMSGPKQKDIEKPYLHPPQTEYQEKMRVQKKGDKGVMNHLCRAHNEKDLSIFKILPQGGKYMDLPKDIRRYRDDIFEDKYKRLKWDEPSWTLTAHMQRDCLAYIHPTQARSISVREAARLQSFPDHFVFHAPMTRMFQLVGNSVPPLLAEAIARPIVEQIKNHYSNL